MCISPRQPIIGHFGTGQRAECLPHVVDAANPLASGVRDRAGALATRYVALDKSNDPAGDVPDLDAPPVARVVQVSDDLPVLVRDVGPRWSRRAAVLNDIAERYRPYDSWRLVQAHHA